jgi:hypothetical protein
MEEVSRFGEEEVLDFEAGYWKKKEEEKKRWGGLLIIRVFVN